MSKIIAGDEMRHHIAYTEFVKQIFAIDPSEMMLAFQHMMKYKIVMPALHLRESFGTKGSLFNDFSTVAQRIGVYTGFDYIDIVNSDEVYVGGTFNILKMIYKLYCTFKIIIHQFILQLLNADKNL